MGKEHGDIGDGQQTQAQHAIRGGNNVDTKQKRSSVQNFELSERARGEAAYQKHDELPPEHVGAVHLDKYSSN